MPIVPRWRTRWWLIGMVRCIFTSICSLPQVMQWAGQAVCRAGRGSSRTKGGRNTCDPDLGPQFHHLLPLLRDPSPSVAELCCAPLLGFFVSLIKGFRNGLRRGLRTMLLALKGKHQGRQAVDLGSHQEEQGGEEESGRRHRAACSQW